MIQQQITLQDDVCPVERILCAAAEILELERDVAIAHR